MNTSTMQTPSPHRRSMFDHNDALFDFNPQFEQVFLSILPSAIFIVLAAWSTCTQFRKPTVLHAPVSKYMKFAPLVLHAGLELALLVLSSTGFTVETTSTLVASSALKFVASLLMISVSLIDHSKSVRPSLLLPGYLALVVLFDAVQTRTSFLSDGQDNAVAYSGVFTASLGLKLVILFLESQSKSGFFSWDVKEHSPEETSSIFSLGVFFWLNNLFLTGYKKVLAIKDLYPLDSALESRRMQQKLELKLDYNRLNGDKFGLVKALVRTFKTNLLMPVIPRLALLGFTFCQPLFVEELLKHLAQKNIDDNTGYGFIGASVLIYAGISISTSLCWYLHRRTLTMIRGALVVEIYKKTLTIKGDNSNESSAVTLMSSDMERINNGLLSLHDFWACIIQVAISSWMLYRLLGLVFLASIGMCIACFAGLMILMRYTGGSQRTWMAKVQSRVGLTATVISNMKNLKMSGLSSTIYDHVQRFRVDELAAGINFRTISILAALLGFTPMFIGPPLTFALAERDLDASKIFTSLSLMLLLAMPLSQIFQFTPQLMSAVACLGRIQAYLEREDRLDYRQVASVPDSADSKSEKTSGDLSDLQPRESNVLTIRDGAFGWEAGKMVLQNINMQVPNASLTIVVGPVGSGKSTLCRSLLGEVSYNEGTVMLAKPTSHVGFCDQTAFLFNGTIRENIIGFSSFDSERYASVIHATALSFDLTTLPDGDKTNIGSDGITLSGGQKQRVSLARALYLDADLLVLDDVFSGLDADTEEQVFSRTFGEDGLLRQRGTSVVLCTHSFKHLIFADQIIALGDGTITEQGAFSELIEHGGYVSGLGLKLKDRTPSPGQTEDGSSHDLNMLFAPHTREVDLPDSQENEAKRQVGDMTIYKRYFKSMGGLTASSCLIFAALWGFFVNFPTIWLKYWTEDNASPSPSHSFAYYAGIYALLQVCALMSLLFLGIAIFIVAIKRTGSSIHSDALKTVIHAPLSFFTSTDTGAVTNLFSQDLNLIDTELPNSFLNTISAVFEVLGQAAVMLTASPYLGITYPFLAAFLYLVQMFYLRTSRQLRLLDLEAKSPLYSHFLDSIKGIATLRAFGFLSDEMDKSIGLLNLSQRPAYLLMMTQQWLNLVLDLLVMVLVGILTTLAVRVHSDAAFTGASLVTLMSFGQTLGGIVIFYTRLETSIGAIARLKSFSETVQPEDQPHEDNVPPTQWPQQGVITFTGASASYEQVENEKQAKLALNNIDLTIASGEKVAICGRTGSGKSSLIALILKLLDPLQSSREATTIDGLPLDRIQRSALRQRILAVPQEAVFIPGVSFQTNLDPFGVATASECETVLKAIGLWDFVTERGGLSSDMTPSTLSAGQKQLISLGRVMLRRQIRSREMAAESLTEGGILLLDEVSSSVDRHTETLMQEIIRTDFKGYTVVSVSHRLDMIMDFDRVVVMDKGSIVEVGNPLALAAQDDSRFGDLVRAASS